MCKKEEKYLIRNDLQEILNEEKMSLNQFSKFAVDAGLSRATIYNIASNPYSNMNIQTCLAIQKLLKVSLNDLFTEGIRYIYKANSRGFTKKNVKILIDEMKKIGIDIKCQVYSRNESMNMSTKYAGNHSLYLDGNLRINTESLPELWIIDIDITNNHMYTDNERIRDFHINVTQNIINFSRKIGVYKINYVLRKNYSFKHKSIYTNECSEQNYQDLIKLGFKGPGKWDPNSRETIFVKKLEHI